LQIYFILQLKHKLKRAKNANKIIINKKEAKKAREIKVETREIRVKIKITKTNVEVDIKASAKIVVTIAITRTNKKYLLKLRK